MSTKTKAPKKPDDSTKIIEVRNAGPVKEFRMEMAAGPGFYRLVAENGSGKSHFQRAWLKATGHDVDVALRDGAKELTVDFNGENILSLKKVKPTGDVEGEIWSDCALADFILPDASDPAVNERRRIEAVVRMIDTEVSDATIRTLLSGVPVGDSVEFNEAVEQCEENALDYVLENEGDTIYKQNVVIAKERVRRRVHEIKRQMEQAGERAQAEITARTMPKPEVVVEISPEAAQEGYEQAIRRVERLSGEAEQRAEQITRQAAIVLGERPDVVLAEDRFNVAKANVRRASEERIELEQRLAVVRANEEAAGRQAVEAEEFVATTRQQAQAWDANKAILDAPVTGATEIDVESARRAAATARTELEQARASESWRESCRLVREAQETREKAFARAAIYESIATSTTGQLAVLLAQAGVEGLTVDEDRLCEIQEGGQLEPLSRLSEGERARIGCKILVKNQSVPYNVLVLPGRLVRSLGPKAYAEVERELISAGLYAIYEQPGEGEELSAEKAN